MPLKLNISNDCDNSYQFLRFLVLDSNNKKIIFFIMNATFLDVIDLAYYSSNCYLFCK